MSLGVDIDRMKKSPSKPAPTPSRNNNNNNYNQSIDDNDDQKEPKKLIHDKYLCYKTIKCGNGQDCKQQTCNKWHDEHDKRRNPQLFLYKPEACQNVWVGEDFEFESNYCPEGDECQYSHSFIEMQYHPEIYFRKEKRGKEQQKAHEEWKSKIAKDMTLYKKYPCSKGDQCEREGINCARWHDEYDKRRDPIEIYYSPTPCLTIYNEETGHFDHETCYCEHGDKCEFAHNLVEIQYHPQMYKVAECPYQHLDKIVNTNASNNNQKNKPQILIKLCPLNKKPQWFIERFGKINIKRIKRNTVYLNEISGVQGKMYLSLDCCPFAHNDAEKRYSDDPPITWNKEDYVNNNKNKDKSQRNNDNCSGQY